MIDVITKSFFKLNCNKTFIFIEMISMFEKNFKQNNQNNDIRRIFSKKLCQFLRNNFEINSFFNIF